MGGWEILGTFFHPVEALAGLMSAQAPPRRVPSRVPALLPEEELLGMKLATQILGTLWSPVEALAGLRTSCA